MEVNCDTRGRIYLPKDLRKKYGEKFYYVEAEERIILIPRPKDAFAALEELGKKLPKKSLMELRKEIAREAEKELGQHVRGH